MKITRRGNFLLLIIAALGLIIYSAAAAQTESNMNQPDDSKNAPLPVLRKPQIVVWKKARRLELFDDGKLVKSYKIALGFAPVGDKRREGDGKTPEGEFYVFTKNEQSKFYLSLGVSYPAVDDAEQDLKENVVSREERDAIVSAIENKRMPPQKTALGGEIYIHGGGAGDDWTRGCVALADANIREIFDAVTVGVAVRIEP